MKSHLSFISMNVGKRGVKGKVREKFKLMIRKEETAGKLLKVS